MIKNKATQVVGAQILALDGTAFNGSVNVRVTGDQTSQAGGAGTVTNKGNGYYDYVPTQAETNFDHIAFTFLGTGAIPVTVQLYTVSDNPSGIKKNSAMAGFTFTMLDLNGNEIANPTNVVGVKRLTPGGSFTALDNPVTVVGPICSVDFTAADLNGDIVTMRFTGAGARPRTFTIVTEP